MNDRDRDIKYEFYADNQRVSNLNDILAQLIKKVNELTEDVNNLAENIKAIEQNQRQEADDRY